MGIDDLSCLVNQDMEDEEVIETVDFSEFEALFQVQRFKKNAQELKREESKQDIS